MSLRVAFDMDGTLADMHAALRPEAERLFGSGPVSAPPAPAAGAPSGQVPGTAPGDLQLTSDQQRQLWERVKEIENFWMTLPEMAPGIVAHVAEVARRRRWEVLFITTRPASAGETTQLQTQRWLDAHGFPLPSVMVMQRSRGRLADALQLDAVVDDRLENCVDVATDSRARPILVWNGPAAGVSRQIGVMGVRVVATIGDAVKLLERMDDARRRSRVVRSLRRMLVRDRD